MLMSSVVSRSILKFCFLQISMNVVKIILAMVLDRNVPTPWDRTFVHYVLQIPTSVLQAGNVLVRKSLHFSATIIVEFLRLHRRNV